MTADRPFLGTLLMLGFCAVAPLGDAIAKLIGAQVSLGFLLAVRFAIQVALLLPLVLFLKLRLTLHPGTAWLVALRTVLHILGAGGMFLALRYLPVADAVAIAFVLPFIMLILGSMILGEEIGCHRIIACTVGFAGTLLVIQPSFAIFGAPALLPLFVAVIFALFMLTTRKIAKSMDPVALQFVSGILACFYLIPILILAPAGWTMTAVQMPDRGVSILLAALGVIGTVAHLLMTWSLRFAPTATLAPMQYLEIPFAVAIGWLIFHEIPGTLASVGIAITVSAGLYIIYRERVNLTPALQ